MNLKLIIFILVVLVAIYIYVKMYKNETQENYSNSKIEEQQNLYDSEPDN